MKSRPIAIASAPGLRATIGLVLAALALAGCDGPRPESGAPATGPSAEAPAAAAAPSATGASEAGSGPPQAEGAPRTAFFGDLHVHTTFSTDSATFGNVVTPEDAYRFGRGEEVTMAGGRKVKRARPLDFMAVTDHAEGFPEIALCNDPSSAAYEGTFCTGMRANDINGWRLTFDALSVFPPVRWKGVCEGDACREAAIATWRRIQKTAQDFDDPGTFTTFVAYEYSPTLPDSGMLHRNIIFRGETVPEQAMSAFDLPVDADLWAWLDEACTGACDAVVIPHNLNFSWGYSFSLERRDGRPYTPEDLARRSRLERLAEIFQIKGASECAVGVGASDEECAYEQLFPLCEDGQETSCARPGSFAREGLKLGLRIEEETGANPLRLGFIGSTDTHNGLAGETRERDWVGSVGLRDNVPEKRLVFDPTQSLIRNSNRNPGGLAGVWAEANTRDSIFAALKRRETFATSGPMMRIRLLAGYGLDPHAETGSKRLVGAVAMGGVLEPDPGAHAPQLVAWAAADPDGPRLARLQIVKAWRENGETREAVYDIACSDGLEPDPQSQKCPDNGAQVDLATCAVSENVGAGELGATWTDPHFAAGELALYYARVIANPTCRSTTYDALALGRAVPAGVPPTEAERAWSSPIWYEPAS